MRFHCKIYREFLLYFCNVLFRKNVLYIYTDGSSLNNPRTGGIGYLFVYLDNDCVEQRIQGDEFGYKGSTNQQMELKACIEALKKLEHLNLDISNYKIEIRTDSMYIVENRNKAFFQWSRNGWYNDYGKPVLNSDLWSELLKVVKKANCFVEFKWVKGHAKDEDNKTVDRLARLSAKQALNDPLSVVSVRRKTSPNKVKLGSVRLSRQRASIRIITCEYLREQRLFKYKYEVLSKGSSFHNNVDLVFSDIPLRDGHSYYVVFNGDNMNPRILKLIREIGIKKINISPN